MRSTCLFYHSVVGQRKGKPSSSAAERVIVVVQLLVALGGHSSVSHDETGLLCQAEMHFMGGPGSLLDGQAMVCVVGDSSGIGAPRLTLSG